MRETQTCGKGLAEHSVLPAAFANVLSAMAENLELHLKALNPNDEKSKAEYEAYTELAKRHQKLFSELEALADQMWSYRELPMATHDPTVMTSHLLREAFEKFVAEEKNLLALLERIVDKHEAMLAEIAAQR